MSLTADRDYTLIIDRSGSMGKEDQQGGKSRWKAAQEGTEALARECAKLDPDGLTVYTFSDKHQKYENVTPSLVEQVFTERGPNGSTNLDGVLKDALDGFHSRKAAGTMKANGETIVVITDGEPNDKKAVARVIVEATKKMDKDEELAILFLQIGKDQEAAAFLRKLDDDLTSEGAKFDVVDTKTFEEAGDASFQDLLLAAVND